MSSWILKQNIRRKLIIPPNIIETGFIQPSNSTVQYITNNSPSKYVLSTNTNITTNTTNRTNTTNDINSIKNQLKYYKDEDNNISYVNDEITIESFLHNNETTIFIYDINNGTFSNNLKKMYENSYTNIKIINNILDLPSIYLKMNIEVFFVSLPSVDIYQTLKGRKKNSNSNYYIYINEKSDIIIDDFFSIFNISIFSSDELYMFYSSNFNITEHKIVQFSTINVKNETFYSIFNNKIIDGLMNLYNINKDIYNDLSSLLQVYAIYFPQFHEFEENNYTFYKGYTDMINLKNAKNEYNDLHTPLSGFLDFYNLEKDRYIVKNQVLMAKSFGIKGFAIYYYWFSENSITGNNMLMSKAVNNFFNEEYDDFNVFFIWANESWSNNVHFNVNSNNHTISNIYNEYNINKNIDNLMKYFKHKNYKKINNKPVLFLHNPEQLTTNELTLLHSALNTACINNNFNGIEFVVYNRNQNCKMFKTYSVAPNPKNAPHTQTINNITYCNYQQMVNDYIENDSNDTNINGVLINYNNTARLFTHNNNHKRITKYYNCDISAFSTLLNYTLNKYRNKNTDDEIGKIFLVNAWNEWGEKMTLEPSNELKFNYLTTLQLTLKNFYNNSIRKNVFTENKIFVNNSNIESIDITKYKYLEFDKFIKITPEEEKKYDFLVICYTKLPILSKNFDFFYKDYYKTTDDLLKIESRIRNTKLKKVILLHDLHYDMFMEGYYRFFNYCKYLNITNIVSIYSDNFEFNIINAYSNHYGFNLFVIPHLIDETIFKNYNQPKEYDILFFGTYSFECYSFRKYLKEILEKYQYAFKIKLILDTTSYTKEKLSKEINKAYITIATKSTFDYFLMKYIEIALSGSLIAGDVPIQSNDFNLSDNMLILDETMSESTIIDKLRNQLKNKDEINRKTLLQFNNTEYLKLKYKPYYYTLMFDKINLNDTNVLKL